MSWAGVAHRSIVCSNRLSLSNPIVCSRAALPLKRFRSLRAAASQGSSKGKPTDPELREKVVEEVKQEPNKDGSGKGKMAGWKAGKIAKKYEEEGGDYENDPGSKNEPKKGPPEPKGNNEK